MSRAFRLFQGAVVALALAAPAGNAEAGDATYASDQVNLRLVAEEPNADGRIRAALLIDLAPGWKTYWRDPGEAGIPPTLDLSNSRNIGPATVGFPPPHRFGDGIGMSNGYSSDLAVAFALTESLPGETTELRLKVMLGVCQDICVPVQAELELQFPSGDEAGRVGKAFAALPSTNDPATAIASAWLSKDGRHLTVVTAGPLDPAASDIFVAGPRGWSFGPPEKRAVEGRGIAFSMPVLSRPRLPPKGPLTVDAVLTQGASASEARDLEVAVTEDGSTPTR